MSEVGIRQLKQNASAVVADVVGGDTVTITDRGRPVAQMTAIPASPLEQLVLAGRVRSPRRDLLRLAEPDPGPSLSEELDVMRAAERF